MINVNSILLCMSCKLDNASMLLPGLIINEALPHPLRYCSGPGPLPLLILMGSTRILPIVFSVIIVTAIIIPQVSL